jgi:Peptidase family M28
MRRWWLAGAALAGACATAPSGGSAAGGTPTTPRAAVAVDSRSTTIGALELRRDLYAFADDSMRGRETGTPDATRAAIFIADRMARLGLEPAGDSGFFQRVPLERHDILASSSFTVERDGRKIALRLGADLLPLTTLGPGIFAKLDASGPLVFGAYGIDDGAMGRHDLAGLDLAGKVLVIVHGAPPGADSAARARYDSQSAMQYLIQAVLPAHPAAVIVLMTPATRDLFDEAGPSLLRAVTLRTGFPEPTAKMRVFPLILLGRVTPGSPLLPRGWPAVDTPQSLDATFTAHVDTRPVPVTGYNVVAISRGDDPALRHSYVAFGAHLDHVGIQSGMTPDSIANGADDDGSGTVSMMAIARATRAIPHRRSLLFVWHTGEEKGLLGSAWFTDHPTVPIDSIVAQLNADMIGRNPPGDLYVVGPNAAPDGQSRVLGAILDSVNAAEPQPFQFDRSWDTRTDPERIYYRSDHYNYARKGIPIIFFTTGLHADYHKVSDSPDKIEYTKMARVDRLIMDLGIAVANRTSRPK